MLQLLVVGHAECLSEMVAAAVREFLGIDVVIVEHPPEAIDYAKKHAPILALVEHRPAMPFWELSRQLKNAAYPAQLPVIAVVSLDGQCTEADLAEYDDCLVKPFELDDLLAKVRQHWAA